MAATQHPFVLLDFYQLLLKGNFTTSTREQ